MASRLTARQRRTNLILLTCAILVIALKLLTSPWGSASAEHPGEPDDGGGASGQLSEEELERRSQEGVITIIINPDPTFETGEAEGNLLIENAETNSHPIVVEITRADTKERIYSSEVIPIGVHVEAGVLAVPLPAGDYDCVAAFSYVDEITEEVLGSGEVAITVHVLA